jgi:manganese-dependent inorganic pyrophosphatase
MESIYIFGHKNPDTDSICAAIVYVHVKNTQTEGHLPALSIFDITLLFC